MNEADKRNVSQLEDKIEHHSFLSIPPDLRDQSSSEAMSFRNLVFQWADIENRMQIPSQAGATLTERHLKAMKRAQFSPTARSRQLDGVAFMEALTSCMRAYSQDRGVRFLDYFKIAYQRQIYDESITVSDDYHGIELSRSMSEMVLEVSKYLEAAGVDAADVPDSLIAELSKALETPESKIHELLICVSSVRNPVYMDDASGDSDDPVSFQIEDPSSSFDKDIEYLEFFTYIINTFNRKAVKEYPRLFLSNGIIRLLRVNTYRHESILYASQLEKLGDSLWLNILVVPYLEYIYVALPVPPTVRSLLSGMLSRSPNNLAIAQYLRVSEAAVSKQYHRYLEQLKAVRRLYESQQ